MLPWLPMEVGFKQKTQCGQIQQERGACMPSCIMHGSSSNSPGNFKGWCNWDKVQGAAGQSSPPLLHPPQGCGGQAAGAEQVDWYRQVMGMHAHNPRSPRVVAHSKESSWAWAFGELGNRWPLGSYHPKLAQSCLISEAKQGLAWLLYETT